MKIQYYNSVLVAILLGIFLFTGMEKAWHHDTFVIKLGRQPLPKWIRDMLEWGLPVAELLVVGLLVTTRTRILGLWASAAMMLAFAGYTAYAAMEPAGFVPCACGKLFNALTWGQHFWVNMGLAGLAVAGIVFHEQYDDEHEADGARPEAQHDIAQSSG
jgi:hypothetical protein